MLQSFLRVYVIVSNFPGNFDIDKIISFWIDEAPKTQKMILEQGGVLPLINLLYSFNQTAQSRALGCLIKLAQSKQVQSELIKDGILDGIAYFFHTATKDTIQLVIPILEKLGENGKQKTKKKIQSN